MLTVEKRLIILAKTNNMKKLILLAILVIGCSKEDSNDSDCECRTVTPPELTSSYTYRFCPDPPVEGFYQDFESTYHSADWWGQWEKENPCD